MKIDEDQTKELLSVALEIAVKFFWGNFAYTFGGQDFLQDDGGPIGARLTMCIARLIMQEWSECFSKILSDNKIAELLKGIYVDDGRSVVSKIENNTRYCKIARQFLKDEKWAIDDELNGVTREARTVMEIREVMNSINKDLEFTTELESDFENLRLPTLSFEIWSDKSGIRHSFYEKPMRSQILTMQRSAQSEQSKISILVNELNRRFEVIDENIGEEERKKVVEHFTKQLVNSGYGYAQAKDIVLSNLKGIKKKGKKKEK